MQNHQGEINVASTRYVKTCFYSNDLAAVTCLHSHY